MKNLPTFDEFINENYLNELRDIYDEEAIEKAKYDKKEISVAWSDGNIVANAANRLDTLEILGIKPLSTVLNFKANTVRAFFMDDWSDFKFIKRLQQMLTDLIRANYITPKWKLIIGFGNSTKINLMRNSTVQAALDYDAELTGRYIPVCFHGTSDYYLNDIKRLGLVPTDNSLITQNWDIGYTKDSGKRIYLTIDFDRAAYYAKHTVSYLDKEEGIKSNPIVVEIRELPTDLIVADDDFLTNMGSLNLLQFLMGGKKVDPENYVQGIRASSQFAYNGRIPKSLIYKFHTIK